jgi:hypothetical protein
MRQAKEGIQMAAQVRTQRCPRRCALLVVPAIVAALGLLGAFAAAVVDPSAPAWSLLRPVALLAASWIPVRLAREAVAYCSGDAGQPQPGPVRIARRIGGVLDASAISTHSFGQAALPGREALPSGSTHT